jgi:hypothetical protein
LGAKEELAQRIESLLFSNYLYKKSPEDNLKDIADTDIETILKNIKSAPSKKDVITKDQLDADLATCKIFSPQKPKFLKLNRLGQESTRA